MTRRIIELDLNKFSLKIITIRNFFFLSFVFVLNFIYFFDLNIF